MPSLKSGGTNWQPKFTDSFGRMYGEEGRPLCEKNGDTHQFATQVFFQVELVEMVRAF